MHAHGHRFLILLIVTAALLASTSTQAAAQSHPRHRVTIQTRVYDRAHRDYHVWNHNEDQAYRGYLGDQHRTYRRFSRLNHRQRMTYWNWRHAHAGAR